MRGTTPILVLLTLGAIAWVWLLLAPDEGRPDAAPQPIAEPAQEAAVEEATPVAATIPGATIIPGTIEREPDGDTVADGQWVFAGSGTKEDPYEVDWDLLAGASETFVPRLGERGIPQRIAMLNGKWVRISGYIAFPLVQTETEELLVLLNQWDGCCIGIPPTPYDAVEVKLRHVVENTKRHTIRYGAVTGIFRIDPYVVEKWLVGLYLMESATLETEL